MSFTVFNSINFAQTFIQYAPLTLGIGMEPAISIASMIRNSILNPPLTWFYNRAEQTFAVTKGTQDYTLSSVPDLAYVEKVSLLSSDGTIIEIKDIYNNLALSPSAESARPNALSVERSQIITSVLNYIVRFNVQPDQNYTATLVYQKRAAQFGPFLLSAASNAAAGNTTYTGVFDPISFPVGATATISGFSNAVNNGSFVVVSCSAAALVVVNGSGVLETKTAFAFNLSWDPIPDQYSDVYNNLFLSECFSMVDDARSQLYRQRGVAAMLSKASGLTEMQKNIFAQQWLQRGIASQGAISLANSGNAGRGI